MDQKGRKGGKGVGGEEEGRGEDDGVERVTVWLNDSSHVSGKAIERVDLSSFA